MPAVVQDASHWKKRLPLNAPPPRWPSGPHQIHPASDSKHIALQPLVHDRPPSAPAAHLPPAMRRWYLSPALQDPPNAAAAGSERRESPKRTYSRPHQVAADTECLLQMEVCTETSDGEHKACPAPPVPQCDRIVTASPCNEERPLDGFGTNDK